MLIGTALNLSSFCNEQIIKQLQLPPEFIEGWGWGQTKTIKMAKEYTDGNFQTDVLASDKLTVVDFWAEWCGPCRAIGPVIEELSKEYDGKVNVGKVNVDVNPQVSMNYGITSIPAILFIKNGQVVDKLVGAQPKGNFVKKIESHI
jgi:thioredoxin 1